VVIGEQPKLLELLSQSPNMQLANHSCTVAVESTVPEETCTKVSNRAFVQHAGSAHLHSPENIHYKPVKYHN
jgi:hypothetical protein